MDKARFLLLGLLVVGCGGRTIGDSDPLDGSTDVSINPDSPIPPPNTDGGIVPPPDFDGGFPPPPDFDAEPPPPPPPPFDASPPPPPPPPPFDAGPPPPPPFDGGFPPPFDGGPPPPFDAGSPPPLTCGNTTCNPQSQQCCITQNGSSCVLTGTCNGGIALSCTGSASCAKGQVCCATLGGGGANAKCASSCGNPPQAIQICNSKADCKPNQNCISVPQVQGLKVCF
jgi:hypothetical protein